MKVLLLGSETSPCETVREFLRAAGEEVGLWRNRPLVEMVRAFSPDLILSYGCRWILTEEIFTFPRLGTVNAHISYLPWNRGAHPNFWSHAEGTPQGVSLHYIDKGIDTGPLVARERVESEEGDTLRTSYDKLHARMQLLLENWWPAIRDGRAPRAAQEPGGTSHLRKHLEPFAPVLAHRGWDTPVREIAALTLDHETIHGERS